MITSAGLRQASTSARNGRRRRRDEGEEVIPAPMRRPGTATPDGVPRYKTASAHAVAVLKAWINDGVLAPGSTIDQVQLSEDLGMRTATACADAVLYRGT